MRDKNLIRRVELRTTGADIHRISELIGYYNGAYDVNEPDRFDKLSLWDQVYVKKMLFHITRVLSEYADDGENVDDIVKKYPLGDKQLTNLVNKEFHE